MESWVPLFDIFLNSPSPEAEAAVWLQQSFDAPSSTNPITTSSFLSLLTRPSDAIAADSSPPSIPTSSTPRKRVLWIETLPDAVQSRILSFLLVERRRFCSQDLRALARTILSRGQGLDFWVEKAARNLLDVLSQPNYDWISCLGLDSFEERVNEEFESLPSWLKDAADASEKFLPWLPLSLDELNSRLSFGASQNDPESLNVDGDGEINEVIMDEAEPEAKNFISPTNAPLDPEIQKMVACLGAQLLSFESTSKTVGLANEIRNLCFSRGGDAFAVLGLIEPWKADDETASVLISHLLKGNEDKTDWPSQVLCVIILPRFLVLENPASRALMIAAIENCKLYPRAAVYALLFPLILRKGGINNPIGDVVTRIIRECLHPAHVSAICQNLLCREEGRKFICLPCHQCLISTELVWTESLFTVFQNILNHNVHLTQDSVDNLVHHIEESVDRLSKSLKFGNFLLCFVSKCSLSLKTHKLLLTEAAQRTSTLVTKSVLSKLASL